MKSLSSESKPFQSRSKGKIPGRVTREERLSRSNQATSELKKNAHFQNEAKCTTFLVKMSYICMRMKNHFHIKGWALSLTLIQRPGGTRKWPIEIGVPNRPFYRYGGHIELIRFKEYYRMPRGMSTFRLYFRALFGTFFVKVFLE